MGAAVRSGTGVAGQVDVGGLAARPRAVHRDARGHVGAAPADEVPRLGRLAGGIQAKDQSVGALASQVDVEVVPIDGGLGQTIAAGRRVALPSDVDVVGAVHGDGSANVRARGADVGRKEGGVALGIQPN